MVIILCSSLNRKYSAVMNLHNSTVYSGKATELDQDTFGILNSWPNENRKEEYFIGVEKGESSFASGASACFGQSIVGLKLGMPKDTENLSSTTNSTAPVSLNSMSSNTAKRPRVSYQSMQTSRCQAEGCNLDLTSAKDYHRRHRICESHSKSPKVIIAGVERRFCQQCSRLVTCIHIISLQYFVVYLCSFSILKLSCF